MNEEKVILVTGGASGLGAGLVKNFARKGYRVVLNYIKMAEERAENLCQELRSEDSKVRILKVEADVTIRGQVQNMFSRTVEEFGRVDALINCAGINRDAPLMQMTDEDWDSVLGTHLKGTFMCCQEFVFHNPNNPGNIINLGAACALQGRENGANFCSAKGGIIALTKCLALELAPRIQVNCLIPGSVDTGEVRERYNLDTSEGLNSLLEGIPMGRLGALEDVINMVDCMLNAKFTTGENFFVNGGEYMH